MDIMEKELAFTFKATEAQILGDEPVHQTFGLTAERAAFLVEEQCNRYKQFPRGATINDLEQFCAFIANEPLTGNDVAFLVFTGWRAMTRADQAIRDFLAR